MYQRLRLVGRRQAILLPLGEQANKCLYSVTVLGIPNTQRIRARGHGMKQFPCVAICGMPLNLNDRVEIGGDVTSYLMHFGEHMTWQDMKPIDFSVSSVGVVEKQLNISVGKRFESRPKTFGHNSDEADRFRHCIFCTSSVNLT